MYLFWHSIINKTLDLKHILFLDVQSDIALKVRVYIIYFKNYNAKDSTN